MVILLFGDATQVLAQSLVNTYAIPHPVVLDHGWQVSNRFGFTSLPSYTLIRPGLKVVSTDQWWVDSAAIERALDN